MLLRRCLPNLPNLGHLRKKENVVKAAQILPMARRLLAFAEALYITIQKVGILPFLRAATMTNFRYGVV